MSTHTACLTIVLKDKFVVLKIEIEHEKGAHKKVSDCDSISVVKARVK